MVGVEGCCVSGGGEGGMGVGEGVGGGGGVGGGLLRENRPHIDLKPGMSLAV